MDSYSHTREYIDCLADFFNATEREFLQYPELKGLENDFSNLVSEVNRLVKTNVFLEASSIGWHVHMALLYQKTH